MVKGNGYGHGAVIAAEAFLAAGAARLAVTTVAEGAELRAAGIEQPILLLASHAPDEADEVLAHGLTATVVDGGAAQGLARAAERRGVVADVHLLIDTGMGRDGTRPGDVPVMAAIIAAEPALRLAGAFTHFPTATERDKTPVRQQLALFRQAATALPTPQIGRASCRERV